MQTLIVASVIGPVRTLLRIEFIAIRAGPRRPWRRDDEVRRFILAVYASDDVGIVRQTERDGESVEIGVRDPETISGETLREGKP